MAAAIILKVQTERKIIMGKSSIAYALPIFQVVLVQKGEEGKHLANENDKIGR